jgi:hypothetical protein
VSRKLSTGARLSRRVALRAGAAVGATSAGLAISAIALAASSPAAQPASTWRREELELDFTPVNPVSIVRAGEGPPQRGDFFHIGAEVYAIGDTSGPQIGEYECFGVWTRASTDTTARSLRLTTVHFNIWGQGSIMGLINEGGPAPATLVGVVQGGAGRYNGALGSFRQTTLSPTPLTVRATFHLILPNVG